MNSVARKMIMALTGQAMVLFALVHMLGNSTIFVGGLNEYASSLRSLSLLVWATRVLMAAAVALHVYFSLVLTLENRGAKPQAYAVGRPIKATLASRTMIWSGLLILAYLVCHLLHFTFQVIDPAAAASANMSGNPDVSGMVLAGLSSIPAAMAYVLALFALLMHLWHGIQSSFQSLGLNNEKAGPFIIRAGAFVSVVMFLGYVSIPVLIMLGILKG